MHIHSSKLSDSGWINFDKLSNITYRKVNGCVMVIFDGATIPGASASSPTLPSDYRPSQSVYFLATTNRSGNISSETISSVINPAGMIIAYGTGAKTIYASTVYQV